MLFKAAAVLSFAATAAAYKEDHYAVLVAGSHTYGNYRHHADIAHAYHIAVNGGIPKDNIIVMMYDDVVNDDENPFPGQLFNAPTEEGTPGVDVYAGVAKDYVGKDVTAANFLSIITGDKQAMQGVGTGRVLESTASDKVFINFVDHGGVGLIAFPSQPYLYAKDLLGALTKMHNQGMYKELVFYLEACESGSMFKKLPQGMNIYATTAANGKESSWGTYCERAATVDGKNMNTCLGDLYSVNWMQDADSGDMTRETLEAQYKVVKRLTNKSHVMQFGDVQQISNEPVADFIGNENNNANATAAAAGLSFTTETTHFDSRDNEMLRLFHAYTQTGSDAYGRKLVLEIQDREKHDARWLKIATSVAGPTEGARLADPATYSDPEYTECHKAVNMAYDVHCGGFSDYALKHVRTVVNLCEQQVGVGGSYAHIVAAVKDAC